MVRRAPARLVFEAASKAVPEPRSTSMPQKSRIATGVIGIDIGKNAFHLVGHDAGCGCAAAEMVARTCGRATCQYTAMQTHGFNTDTTFTSTASRNEVADMAVGINHGSPVLPAPCPDLPHSAREALLAVT